MEDPNIPCRFYGTTSQRTPNGPVCDDRNNCGVIFALDVATRGLTLLHQFGSVPDDGKFSYATLRLASDGYLYGTTGNGGGTEAMCPNGGCGTVFRIKPDGSQYSIVHRFTGSPLDGFSPETGLIETKDASGVPTGMLYGTTLYGGSNLRGTLYQVVLGSSPAYTFLESFVANGTDGFLPNQLMQFSGDHKLYGTTQAGGTGSAGVIFTYDPASPPHVVAHNFTTTEIDQPAAAGLVEAANGKLYGVSSSCGGCGTSGTVFEFDPALPASLITVHTFAGFTAGDGRTPLASLLQASDGILYGTTLAGGRQQCASGCGTVFHLVPGSVSPGPPTFHAFRNVPLTDSEGVYPVAELVEGSDGVLYGTTWLGGPIDGPNSSMGTVFRIAKSGGGPAWVRQLGETGRDDFANAVTVDDSGPATLIYVAGGTASTLGCQRHGQSDAFLARFTSTGTLDSSFGGCGGIHQIGPDGATRYAYATGAAVDGGRNVYIVGTTEGLLGPEWHGLSDGFVAKLDSAGRTDWLRQLGTSQNDTAAGVALGRGVDQGVYVIGWTQGNFGGERQGALDTYLAKFSPNGASSDPPLWVRQWGGPADSVTYPFGVATCEGADGTTIYVTSGDITDVAAGRNLLTSYDERGVLNWRVSLDDPGPFGERRNGKLVADSDCSVYVGGEASSFGETRHPNFLVAKYDSNGNMLWENGGETRFLNDFDNVNAVALDSAGHVYIAGSTNNLLGGIYYGGGDLTRVGDVWFAAYNPQDGTQERAGRPHQYGSGVPVNGFDETAQGMAVDKAGNIYLAGWTTGNFEYSHAPEVFSLDEFRDAFLLKANASLSQAPRITYFSPTSGSPGDAVDIVGYGFIEPVTVAFGGVPAIAGVVSDHDIEAIVPDGAVTGPITITTPLGSVTSVDIFTVR